MAVLKPLSPRIALVLALLAAAAIWGNFVLRGAHRGGWRVDEAYKASETYALHHLLRGEVHHPDWFRERIDRTNPPFGKYVFGLAVLIAGERLPERSTLTRASTPRGEVTPHFPEHESAPFLPLLRPIRHVSILATALTAGILAYLAARLNGIAAALMAVLLFATHWMTQTFGPTAIFDPLLTFLVMATAPLLMKIWNEPRRAMILAPIAAVLAAMAFQTRLNGAIAIVGVLVVLAGRRRFVAAILAVIVFVAAATLINPFYWAGAPDDPAIPAEVRAPRSLVPRVVSRYELQIRELSQILALFRTGGVRLPLWAAESTERARTPWTITTKLRFLRRCIATDVSGVLMTIGALLGLFVSRKWFAVIWCATIAGGTCQWLPLPWPRYLFVILPPLALLAGIGFASLISRYHERHATSRSASVPSS